LALEVAKKNVSMTLKKFFLKKNYSYGNNNAEFVADFKAIEKFAKKAHTTGIYKK